MFLLYATVGHECCTWGVCVYCLDGSKAELYAWTDELREPELEAQEKTNM